MFNYPASAPTEVGQAVWFDSPVRKYLGSITTPTIVSEFSTYLPPSESQAIKIPAAEAEWRRQTQVRSSRVAFVAVVTQLVQHSLTHLK